MPRRRTSEAVLEQRNRSAEAAGLQIRAGTDDTPPGFVGHAAVFNSRTAIGNPLTWGFYEQIAPGAFTKTLQEGDARFLVDHDSALIVSRVSAGDLSLRQDKRGLAVDSDLDQELSYVRDLTRNVQARRITGMSFGFTVPAGGDDWTTETVETKDGNTAEVEVRTIREVKLLEVSAVTFPAYDETDAALRALSLRADPDPLGRRSQFLAARKERPVVTAGQMRRAVESMAELRAGKVLSAANVQLLSDVLATLASADEAFDPFVTALVSVDQALDDAQANLSDLLGVANPDSDDPEDDRSARAPGGSTRESEPAAATRIDALAEYDRLLALRYGLSA